MRKFKYLNKTSEKQVISRFTKNEKIDVMRQLNFFGLIHL